MKTYKDTVTGEIWEFDDEVTDVNAFPNTPATLEPYTRPAPVQPTAAELQAAADAVTNRAAKIALTDIDAQSIRAMREFILAKFPGDPALPAVLASHDAAAANERAKFK